MGRKNLGRKGRIQNGEHFESGCVHQHRTCLESGCCHGNGDRKQGSAAGVSTSQPSSPTLVYFRLNIPQCDQGTEVTPSGYNHNLSSYRTTTPRSRVLTDQTSVRLHHGVVHEKYARVTNIWMPVPLQPLFLMHPGIQDAHSATIRKEF